MTFKKHLCQGNVYYTRFVDIAVGRQIGSMTRWPAQRVTGSDRVKFTVKNQKTFSFCWNCLKSDCLKSLAVFECLLIFFLFYLKLSVPEKFKNSILETPIAGRLMEQSLKNVQWRQFLLPPYCCLKVDWYFDPHSGSQGVKGLKFPNNQSKN